MIGCSALILHIDPFFYSSKVVANVWYRCRLYAREYYPMLIGSFMLNENELMEEISINANFSCLRSALDEVFVDK